MQLGEYYYPKLQCAVPFSPVPGARLLVAPGENPRELRGTMLNVLPQVADALKVRTAQVQMLPLSSRARQRTVCCSGLTFLSSIRELSLGLGVVPAVPVLV